jgi:hypothetical protein
LENYYAKMKLIFGGNYERQDVKTVWRWEKREQTATRSIFGLFEGFRASIGYRGSCMHAGHALV